MKRKDLIREMHEDPRVQARQYREAILIKKAFKIHITRRKNELSMIIDPFIEELDNGKKFLLSDGDIAKIDKIIKKLKKVMKRIDKFNRWIDFIPPRYFRRPEDNED